MVYFQRLTFLISPLVLYLVVFVLAHKEYGSDISEIRSSYHTVHNRQKRLLPLTYLNTSVLSFICGFGVPVQDLDYETITAGVVFKAQYNLPRTPQDLRQTAPLNVNGRNAFEDFFASQSQEFSKYRWTLYNAMTILAEQLGFSNGKVCLLRSICESAAVSFHYGNGIIGDLVHILLTPSSSIDGLSVLMDNEYLYAEALGRSGDVVSCTFTFSECAKSFLAQFSHIFDDNVE